jgi:hypothetical protein
MTTSRSEAGIRFGKRFCKLFGLLNEVGIWVADDSRASILIQGQDSRLISEDTPLAASGRASPWASSCMLHSIGACRSFGRAHHLQAQHTNMYMPSLMQRQACSSCASLRSAMHPHSVQTGVLCIAVVRDDLHAHTLALFTPSSSRTR